MGLVAALATATAALLVVEEGVGMVGAAQVDWAGPQVEGEELERRPVAVADLGKRPVVGAAPAERPGVVADEGLSRGEEGVEIWAGEVKGRRLEAAGGLKTRQGAVAAQECHQHHRRLLRGTRRKQTV